MPWPLSERLVLSSHPAPDEVRKRYWNDSGVCMITLSKKQVDPSIPPMLDRYIYHPIPDGLMTPEREAEIWKARDVTLGMMYLTTTRLTVIHCLAGKNRSGLIGALVMQWTENWTGTEALAWVRQCRPNAVDNIHFERFLQRLGRPR